MVERGNVEAVRGNGGRRNELANEKARQQNPETRNDLKAFGKTGEETRETTDKMPQLQQQQCLEQK